MKKKTVGLYIPNVWQIFKQFAIRSFSPLDHYAYFIGMQFPSILCIVQEVIFYYKECLYKFD